MTTTAQEPIEFAGRSVSRVGYGAMQLERLASGTQAERDAAIALLRTAVELGVNHIDTAAFYGDATVNRLIAEALHPYPDDLVLVSKVGAHFDPVSRLVAAQQPAQLRDEVERNLGTLEVEQVAVVNLRRADAPPGIIAVGDQLVPLDDQLAELVALRNEGKIGGIGLSNVSAAQLAQALPAGIVCVQNHYSVLERSSEPVLELCRANGIVWAPYFPLGSAFAQLPNVGDDDTVRGIARDLEVTPAQVGLAWQLAHYERTVLIAGTTSEAHLRENLAAADIRLDAAQVAALDQLSPVPVDPA